MGFTIQEIENIANAALDFHVRDGVLSQTLQDKPLLRYLRQKQKMFSGGKGLITKRVKGLYDTEIQGYTGDDTVAYGNPANIRTANAPWKEIHWGIRVTLTELKIDGISITDTALGKGEQRHEGREMHVLAGIFDDKLEDMEEGGARGMNLMMWRDGTQDSKEVPGIKSIIVSDPTAAVDVLGIDQSANPWWRNRSNVAIAATSANANDQVLVGVLQAEMRQLRRYGSPKHLALAGSDFLTQFELELRAKGSYTQTGWNKEGGIDAGMADPIMKGVRFEYDPTLDDEGESDCAYLIDTNAIRLYTMEGEDFKRHNPARPAEKYVLYRALTWTGGLLARQRNTSGKYKLA